MNKRKAAQQKPQPDRDTFPGREGIALPGSAEFDRLGELMNQRRDEIAEVIDNEFGDGEIENLGDFDTWLSDTLDALDATNTGWVEAVDFAYELLIRHLFCDGFPPRPSSTNTPRECKNALLDLLAWARRGIIADLEAAGAGGDDKSTGGEIVRSGRDPDPEREEIRDKFRNGTFANNAQAQAAYPKRTKEDIRQIKSEAKRPKT